MKNETKGATCPSCGRDNSEYGNTCTAEDCPAVMARKALTKHTPGPWETGCIMTNVEMRPAGWNASLCIADCHTWNAPRSSEERIANARLIASAPALLAALKSIVAADACNYDRDTMRKAGYFDIARDAIAAAEGGAL